MPRQLIPVLLTIGRSSLAVVPIRTGASVNLAIPAVVVLPT